MGTRSINADRRRGPEGGPAARFVETDLADVGQVAGLLKGCDAVVHLGAIPSPWGHADEVVFTNNTINTYAGFPGGLDQWHREGSVCVERVGLWHGLECRLTTAAVRAGR